MLITDCKRLYRKAVKHRGLKFCEAAKLSGISDSNVRTSLTYQIVNKNYIKIAEAIGYDIRITFVPRDDWEKNNDKL